MMLENRGRRWYTSRPKLYDPGQVSEWLKEPVSKTGIPVRVSRVRIPPCPLFPALSPAPIEIAALLNPYPGHAWTTEARKTRFAPLWFRLHMTNGGLLDARLPAHSRGCPARRQLSRVRVTERLRGRPMAVGVGRSADRARSVRWFQECARPCDIGPVLELVVPCGGTAVIAPARCAKLRLGDTTRSPRASVPPRGPA